MIEKARIIVRLLRDDNGNRVRYSAKAIVTRDGVMTYTTRRSPADIRVGVTQGFDRAAEEIATREGLVGEWRAHLDPVRGVHYYCPAETCNCPPHVGRRSTLACFTVTEQAVYAWAARCPS